MKLSPRRAARLDWRLDMTEQLTNRTLVKDNGTTTCCDAYTSISMIDAVEYCKNCYDEVEGYVTTTATTITIVEV